MKSSKISKIKWSFIVFFIPVFLWLFLLIVLPHFELLRMSFMGRSGFTLENYGAFFTEPIYWLTFVRTALYSILVTFIVLIIALPIAFFITKVVNLKIQGVLLVLLLVPFWVSELIRVYGWMILLRESGVLNHFLVGIGLFNYDLGAKKIAIWREIIIPYSMPGIVSGSIIVFMLVLGSYLTPKLMGGKNSLWFTEQIYNQIITYFNWNQGAAFGFLLLVLSSFIIWVALKLTKQDFREVIK
jgi:spermidine/putrescine transport system permease protein